MPRRQFWLKRRPMVHRWFGSELRALPQRHWGLTFSEWYRLNRDLKKRRNPFIKRPWRIQTMDRHGRPRNHPLFRKSENSH